jgi:Tfp pilus assembly protein PilF
MNVTLKRTLRFGTFAIALLLAIGCSHQSDLSRPASQDNFGVQMARLNLWREAMFRFERAIQINPGDAQAHNNLAVAYEANGDFEKARKEYLEALKLDRTNPYIQKNYSRFVEFLSRNKKRQTGTKSASTPLAGATPSATSTTVINSGQPDRPIGSGVPPPTAISPPAAPPSDRPQPPPLPPPAKPPGGAV